VEGSGRGPVEVLYRHLCKKSDRNQAKLQSVQPAGKLIFETGTF
jgi:hypothetical protein